CYGYGKKTTPQIDRIAANGTLFAQTFSQATNTFGYMPRALSSRYLSAPVFEHDAWRYGIQAIRKKPDQPIHTFDERQVFLPELLSAAGYKTLLIHNHAFFSPQTRIARLFDETIAVSGRGGRPKEGDLFERFFDWLARHRDQRFFVWLHVLSPHEPYLPKAEEAEFLTGVAPGTVEKVRKRLHNHSNLDVDTWTRDSIEAFHGLYDANLRHVDGWVGTLGDELERLELDRDTLLIITSDHGENLGQHGLYGHGGPPWDSVTHVPLIMSWPGVIPSSTQRNGLTESIDIAPTILELVGVEIPAGKLTDGTSLVPLLAGQGRGRDASLVLKRPRHAHEEGLRTSTHKFCPGTGQLCDLRTDPGETSDVARQQRSTVRKLRRRFEMATTTYRERFERAVLTEPPDFPFYLPITSLEVGPPSAVRTIHERNEKRTLEQLEQLAEGREAGWALNLEYFNHGLVPLPKHGAAPAVTLKAKLPSGSYRVSLLVAAFEREPSGRPINEAGPRWGLRYRLPQAATFRRPASTKRFEASHNEWYVELGTIDILDDLCVLEIAVDQADAAYWQMIRHVAFAPPTASQEEENEPGADEFDEKIERLKALGYL
ncbi:MAG: sulfatase, partial [Acidobacteriota bacterium]